MRWAWFLKLLKGTKSEKILEGALCRLGVPYRFQYPYATRIFDFTLPLDKVIIEVDGPSHLNKKQKDKDNYWDKLMAERGWKVLRCTNEEAQRDPVGTVNRLMALANLPYRVSEGTQNWVSNNPEDPNPVEVDV